MSELLNYFRVLHQYPEDRKFSFIIDDNKLDGTQTSIVDFAFGVGCEFLNIKGFFKTEKLAKVIRYAEIIDYLRQH